MRESGEEALRLELVEVGRLMNASGLNQGTSGNLSVRLDDARLLITPTGQSCESLRSSELAVLHLDGQWAGPLRPSSEWRFHRDIHAFHPHARAVLHAHSRYSTALACLGLGIPAFHYMVAKAGGADIRCAPYATFGSQRLSDLALDALEGRKACLLANHGLITLGQTLHEALALAIEVEHLAHMYLLAREIGPPQLLDASEMERVLKLFETYGTTDFPDDGLRRLE